MDAVSYDWTPICESCGTEGPKIRSGMDGLRFGPDHVASTELLKQWLTDHEQHAVRLRGEGAPVQPVQAQDYPRFQLNTTGPLVVSLSAATVPGTRQIIGNRGSKPLVIRESGNEGLPNRFVFPPGVREVIVPPHGTAVFVAKKPSRWQRLWGRLTGRPAVLRWKWDQATSKPSNEGALS